MSMSNDAKWVRRQCQPRYRCRYCGWVGGVLEMESYASWDLDDGQGGEEIYSNHVCPECWGTDDLAEFEIVIDDA